MGALFEKPAFLLLGLMFIGGFIALVVVLATRPGVRRGPAVGGSAAGSTSETPMTLHAGRWLRWDGSQWRDAETGSPIVDAPGPTD
jgi:hypothetical protein